MSMLVLRYMFITVLTNRLANNSADMFNSDLVYVFNSESVNILPEVRRTCSPVAHPISSTVILPTCSEVPWLTGSPVPRSTCSPVTWPTCSPVPWPTCSPVPRPTLIIKEHPLKEHRCKKPSQSHSLEQRMTIARISLHCILKRYIQ